MLTSAMPVSRWVLATILSVGCASSPGTRPHDMSAGAHENEAAALDEGASGHERTGRTIRDVDRAPCVPSTRQPGIAAPCWSATARPGAQHHGTASEQRRTAAEHRAASRALRDAEAAACSGIAEDDRDVSPFARVDDIADVRPLVERVGRGADRRERVVGVTVIFKPVPGLTATTMQRIVECHLARNAVLGHVDTASDDCPLVPRGVEADVTSAPDGIAVAIRGADDTAVDAIRARGEKLAARLPRRQP